MMDLDCVKKRVALWNQHLPDVKMHYAVKANNDERLLSLMVEMGCNFDCASSREIDTVLKLGAKPSQIIFANSCKPVPMIEHARSVNVRLMTFDCVEEAVKIVELFPAAELVLRIAVDETDAPCPMGKKFGSPPKFWLDILKTCKEIGANLRGISFHVGSGGCDVKVYYDSLVNAKIIFDMAAKLSMKPLDLLDIGGGFSMSAANDANNFDKSAPIIRQHIAKIFPAS